MIDELVVGYLGEWDLSSGDVIEHKVHDDAVDCIALSGDMIVTSYYNGGDANIIRVFNVSTCLLVLS